MTAWRLRDCRRWLDAGHRTGYALWHEPRRHVGGLASNSPLGLVLDAAGAYKLYPGDRQTRVLDQLIGRYGPDALVQDVLRLLREQAERADHKVGPDAEISDGPHTNADAATHGGDGNSGEMDHLADTATDREGETSTKENTPDGQPASSAAEDDAQCGASEQADGASHAEGQPTGKGDTGSDEATQGMGSHHATDDAPDADETATGNGCSAMGGGAGGSVDKHARAEMVSGDAEAPGGRHESGSRSAAVASYATVRTTARVARALSRLVAEASRPEPSPLWDGKRVVREIVSRQVRLHRMRRDIRAPRSVLVLYDISGSCGWIADTTWAVAAALAERYTAFMAAPTGGPSLLAEGSLDTAEIAGRGQIAAAVRRLPAIVDRCGYGDDITGWRRLRSAGVSHLLVLGDAHGEIGYRTAAQAGIRVLWANPNREIAPDDTSWCAYTLIDKGDIASAIEALTSRSHP